MLRALATCPGTLSRKQLFNNATAFHPSVDLVLQDPQLQKTEAAFAAISSAAEHMYQSVDTPVAPVESMASAQALAAAAPVNATATAAAAPASAVAPAIVAAPQALRNSVPSMTFGQIDPYDLMLSERSAVADFSAPLTSNDVASVATAPTSVATVPASVAPAAPVMVATLAAPAKPIAPATSFAASARGSLASMFRLPASRRDIAQAVFNAVNGTATAAPAATAAVVDVNGANGIGAVESEIADLSRDMDADFDPQAMAQYAYATDEEPENQESFARFLRMHFPEESAAVTASAESASVQHLPQTGWSNDAKRTEVWAPVPRHISASSGRPASRQPLFTFNARASTSHESIAGILARDFGSIGVGSRGGRSTSFSSASKVPAAQVYEERLKQLSLAQQARIQSAPYVEVSSDNISGATKISVNSMAQHLSAHLLPESLIKDEQEAVSTVVTTTPAPSLAQAADAVGAAGIAATADANAKAARTAKGQSKGQSIAADIAATEVVKAFTAQATAQEQAQVKALATNADPLTAALDQALLQPMSTKVAILDAVATAPQRLHPVSVSQDSLPSHLGRSVMYAASECGRDPVLSSVSPQVAAAVAAIAAEERALEQKVAEASTTLVNSITAQGHTVVTGYIAVPLDEVMQDENSAGNKQNSQAQANGAKGKGKGRGRSSAGADADAKRNGGSDLRIVRNQGNQAFVPSMEGVVSTDMSRRVQAHGALAAVGLRSSLNEAAATALGLDVSSQVLYPLPAANTPLGMINGTSEVNGTALNARAMRASLSPFASERRAVDYNALEFNQPVGPIGIEAQAQIPVPLAQGSMANTMAITATSTPAVQGSQAGAPKASWVRSWELNKEIEQAAHGSDFSTATSRAALAAMQSAEALASLQDSLNLVAAPDLIRNEVLVRNNTTRIVTNSQRAKDYFARGAKQVEVELARKRQEQERQAKQPSTVISQYDVLLPAARDFLGQSEQAVASEAVASEAAAPEVAAATAAALETGSVLMAESLPLGDGAVFSEQNIVAQAVPASVSVATTAAGNSILANESVLVSPTTDPLVTHMPAAAATTSKKAKASAKAKAKATESLLMPHEDLSKDKGKSEGAPDAADSESKAKPKSRTRVVVTTRKARRSGATSSSSKTI